MSATLCKEEQFYNPLDVAEMVMLDRDLSFDRSGDGDLFAEIEGAWCNYKIWFAWQEEYHGLSLTCALDTKLPKISYARTYPLLAIVNEKLWAGHFGIDSESSQVVYRYTLMVAEDTHVPSEQMGEMIDHAVQECERFYPALQAVVWGGKDPKDALAAAIFETVAEA